MKTQTVSAKTCLIAVLFLSASAPAWARDGIGDGLIDLPNVATGSRLADLPLAQDIVGGMSQSLNGLNINVALVGGEKATAGDCLGIEIRAGQFRLDFGSMDFQIDSTGIELSISIDEISLTAIKIRTKSPASLCDWNGTFEVGGSATDIKLTVHFDPRVRLDDCYLVRLGEISAHVSIGGLNLKPLQNDIDKLVKKLIQDAINEKIDIDIPGILENALNSSLLIGICQTKIYLYKAYMAALALGVDLYGLPNDLVEKLQPHYPTVDLGSVQFGYRWQPSSNNTTDCHHMFFSDPDMVQRLRHGMELDANEWNLVFHELQHTEQCSRIGGRDEFAKRWFKDLELAVLLTHLSDPVSYLWELHDKMPMEVDATDRSDEIVVIHGTVRDADTGAPVSDIAVSAHEPGAKTILPTTRAIASDVTSSPGLKGIGAGRYTFFLEAGEYDLYLRPVTTRTSKKADAGFTVRTGDLEIAKDFIVDADGQPIALPSPVTEAKFIRGDSNSSTQANLSDALFTLGWLFGAGEAPRCVKAADVNDDGAVDVSDPLTLLGYLFLGLNEPPAPFGAAGTDPTEDSLPCDADPS